MNTLRILILTFLVILISPPRTGAQTNVDLTLTITNILNTTNDTGASLTLQSQTIVWTNRTPSQLTLYPRLVAATNTTAKATTNLYTKLRTTFGNTLLISYASSTSMVIRAPISSTLSASVSTNWASLAFATNQIATTNMAGSLAASNLIALSITLSGSNISSWASIATASGSGQTNILVGNVLDAGTLAYSNTVEFLPLATNIAAQQANWATNGYDGRATNIASELDKSVSNTLYQIYASLSNTVYRSEVNLRDFGTGAFGTDAKHDTAAWYRAMDYLKTNFNGGTLYVPAGLYLATNIYPPTHYPAWYGALPVTNNIQIRGDGEASILRMHDDVSTGVCLLFNHETNGNFFGNLTFKDITLDGNIYERLVSTPGESETLSVKGGSNFFFFNVTFLNTGQNPYDIDTGYQAARYIWVDSCKFLHGYGGSIHSGHPFEYIRNCYFYSNGFGDQVGAVRLQSTGPVYFEGNTFVNNYHDFNIEGGNAYLYNNRFLSTVPRTNIVIWNASDFEILNNRFELATTNCMALLMTNGVSNVRFNGNKVYSYYANTYGVLANGVGLCTFKDNHIVVTATGSYGIMLTNNHSSHKYILIDGNYIEHGNNGQCIVLNNVSNAVVSNNKLRSGYIQLGPDGGVSRWNHIVGNVIDNYTAMSIRLLSGANTNTLANNICSGNIRIVGQGNRVLNNIAPVLDLANTGNVLSHNYAPLLGTAQEANQVWRLDLNGTNSYLPQLRSDWFLGNGGGLTNLQLSGVATWPANASGVLTNDGAGVLGWGVGASGTQTNLDPRVRNGPLFEVYTANSVEASATLADGPAPLTYQRTLYAAATGNPSVWFYAPEWATNLSVSYGLQSSVTNAWTNDLTTIYYVQHVNRYFSGATNFAANGKDGLGNGASYISFYTNSYPLLVTNTGTPRKIQLRMLTNSGTNTTGNRFFCPPFFLRWD